MSQHEANWDLDSDEIASIASEELHENRPNRWRGSKATWRYVTEEERMLWRSMKQLQDEDLGVHLYNAFALKKRATNPETAKDSAIKTEDGQEGVWAPPKMWTAWPMQQKHIPPAGLFKDEGDGDDEFTLRRQEKVTPSSELRAELTATILRLAKERFSRRKPPQPVEPSIETPASPRLGDSGSEPSDESESELLSRPTVSQATDVSVIDDEQPTSRSGRKSASRTFDPVVSTDDDLSTSLLKPSVQHILTQMDKTLTILHNARVAGLSYLSDSSGTETEEGSDAAQTPTRKRDRGRPRLPPQPSSEASPGGSRSRRGRPRTVHMPDQGETQEQMEQRLAKRGHRRLPATAEDREAAFEEWLRQGDERVAREQRRLQSRPVSEEPESHDGDDRDRMSNEDNDEEEEARPNIERKIRRWGLRDWSDVVGAAALAGFPPQVIARTTQRCANLFGQGMAFTQIDEAPAARASASVRTTTYRPERIRLSSSPSDSDEDNSDAESEPRASLRQRRIASRQASLARSSREASTGTPRRGRPVAAATSPHSPQPGGSSRSCSRSRSRSRSHSAAGILFCPVASCDRAAAGFTRGTNLRRHMRLVHPERDQDAVGGGGAAEDEDSEDETMGAVHVDGFLRTINPGKGWRGEDVLSRKRRGTARSPTPPGNRPAKKVDIASSLDSE
ncbi:RNA polymerase I specific transcription initiation factor [Beauveria brongniartii RCEF 3172]|uniref:RNA polymerase I specific transcription initiation factor n=1 Tax=Beauveria brongniartii RCEF 3172 TaxID=1081107 RepID=A0A167CFF0_9HYPO|nr:RNA polymerase I specific transcription initiation factor [Beauveria brongniartii RCEF 3172]